MLSGCLRRPQSFLERIAFAETALWGDACAAPDSGVTLFIAQLPEHVVTLEAGASSQHLAPGSLPLLSLQSRPKAEIHSLSCVALFDTGPVTSVPSPCFALSIYKMWVELLAGMSR